MRRDVRALPLPRLTPPQPEGPAQRCLLAERHIHAVSAELAARVFDLAVLVPVAEDAVAALHCGDVLRELLQFVGATWGQSYSVQWMPLNRSRTFPGETAAMRSLPAPPVERSARKPADSSSGAEHGPGGLGAIVIHRGSASVGPYPTARGSSRQGGVTIRTTVTFTTASAT